MSSPQSTPSPASTPPLSGELVVLRPADGRDAPRLKELLADPEVARLTGSAHTSDHGTVEHWTTAQLVEIYDRWAEADDRHVWVIVDRTTGEVVGEALLLDIDVDNSSCGFRIWIGGDGARDRGLGTEATRLAVAFALGSDSDAESGSLGLHRVELEVYAFNPRARRAYEKVGFVLEGTKREALRYDEGWVDCHVMAILAQDWTSCG